MQTPEIKNERHAHTAYWQDAAVHAFGALVTSGQRAGWTPAELADSAFNLADALLMERNRRLYGSFEPGYAPFPPAE
jgi:hypothetical protein